MNGVDKIKKQILLEAHREADKLNKESKAQIAELRKKANKELDAKKAKVRMDGDKRAKMEKQRVLSNAKLQAHNLKLQSREQLIQGVFGRALDDIKKLQAKASSRYKKALQKLAKEGKAELDIAKASLSFNAADSKKFGKAIAKSAGSKLGPHVEIEGGVIVESLSGNLKVDNSIEMRFERQTDALRNETAKSLFGGAK
jgi:V/A-type H+-transporting ATPase subunit E